MGNAVLGTEQESDAKAERWHQMMNRVVHLPGCTTRDYLGLCSVAHPTLTAFPSPSEALLWMAIRPRYAVLWTRIIPPSSAAERCMERKNTYRAFWILSV